MNRILNNVIEVFLLTLAMLQLIIGDDMAGLILIMMAHYISTHPFERWLGGD